MNEDFPKLSEYALKSRIVRGARRKRKSAQVIAFEPRAAAIRDLRKKIHARASAHEKAGASDGDES